MNKIILHLKEIARISETHKLDFSKFLGKKKDNLRNEFLTSITLRIPESAKSNLNALLNIEFV